MRHFSLFLKIGALFGAIGLYFFSPFWILHLINGYSPWWRIPVIHSVIFDDTMYLTWVGYLQANIPFANNIGWYACLIRALNALFTHASIAELWLVTAWLSATLSAFFVYGFTRKMIGLDTKQATAITLASWFCIQAHTGWRPGAYSWYFPVGIGAVACLVIASRYNSRWRRLIFLAGAVLLASIYPWFLIPIALWAGVILFSTFPERLLLTTALWTGASLAAVSSCFLAIHYPSDHLIATIEVFQRYGLGFTHLPFFTSAILLPICWLIVLGVQARAHHTPPRALFLWQGWLVLLFCFEMGPFAGIVFQNDHFRALALILSWMSLSIVYQSDPHNISKQQKRLIYPVLGLALLMTFWKIALFLLQPFHDLAMVQAAYWIPLTWATITLVFSNTRTRLLFIVPAVCVGLGTFAATSIMVRASRDPAALVEQEHVRDQILSLVPATQQICIDPLHADTMAAITPRMIIPSVTYRFLPESEATQTDFLRGYFDGWRGANTGERAASARRLAAQDQYLPCSESSWIAAPLLRLSWNQDQINTLTGCPQRHINDVANQILDDQKSVSKDAFLKSCPWVLVMPGQEDSWKLPVSSTRFILSRETLLVRTSPSSTE